jgi:hypothetical protein
MMNGVSPACEQTFHLWSDCHQRRCGCACHYTEAATAIGEYFPLFMGPPDGRDMVRLYRAGMLISISNRTNEEEN